MGIKKTGQVPASFCAFRNDEIAPDLVQRLLRAALLETGATSGNTCELYVSDEARDMERLADVRECRQGECFRSAPLAVAVVADKLGDVALEEHCIEVVRVLGAAASECGLSSVTMFTRGYMLTDGTQSEDAARGILGIPDGKTVFALMAFGYSSCRVADVDDADLEWDRIHIV